MKCLEEDTRLTRSVHFHRDFFHHRSILSVHEAAYVALSGILQTAFFGVAATGDNLTSHGPEGRKEVAANIRAYWDRYKHIPLEERWYLILADDKSPTGHWLQAAGNIVRPTNVTVLPGSMVFTATVTVPAKPNEAPKLRGEVLRKKTNPSVTQLLIKRTEAFSKSGFGAGADSFASHDSCKMVLHLARWDGPAALPSLERHMRLCRDRMAQEGDSSWTTTILARYMAQMTQARIQAKDPKALEEYADWIATTPPASLGSYVEQAFQPMWRHPDDPHVVKAAERLFDNPKSPWLPYRTLYLLETPLLGLPAFRRALLSALADKSAAGTVTIGENGRADVDTTVAWSSGTYADKLDSLTPKPGVRVSFRVCDLYAAELSKRAAAGLPLCRLYWPEAKRDQAVAACAAFLRQYGERFKYVEESPSLHDDSLDKARMVFPPLDRAATAEDVIKGLAIFSLPPKDKPRVWKLPARPLAARWLALKDYPFERTSVSSGTVWQSEEVERDGKVQRWFGFVAWHGLARVPAEEMEFPADYSWAPLSRGLDCHVSTLGASSKDDRILCTGPGVGDPLLTTLKLRNRNGVEQSVPAAYYRRGAAGSPALHAGMRVRLWHAPEKISTSNFLEPPAQDSKDWHELTAKQVERLEPGGARKTLEPTEELTAFQCDLNDLFPITKGGAYRMRIVFTAKDGGVAEGQSNEVNFSLAKPRGMEKP